MLRVSTANARPPHPLPDPDPDLSPSPSPSSSYDDEDAEHALFVEMYARRFVYELLIIQSHNHLRCRDGLRFSTPFGWNLPLDNEKSRFGKLGLLYTCISEMCTIYSAMCAYMQLHKSPILINCVNIAIENTFTFLDRCNIFWHPKFIQTINQYVTSEDPSRSVHELLIDAKIQSELKSDDLTTFKLASLYLAYRNVGHKTLFQKRLIDKYASFYYYKTIGWRLGLLLIFDTSLFHLEQFKFNASWFEDYPSLWAKHLNLGQCSLLLLCFRKIERLYMNHALLKIIRKDGSPGMLALAIQELRYMLDTILLPNVCLPDVARHGDIFDIYWSKLVASAPCIPG